MVQAQLPGPPSGASKPDVRTPFLLLFALLLLACGETDEDHESGSGGAGTAGATSVGGSATGGGWTASGGATQAGGGGVSGSAAAGAASGGAPQGGSGVTSGLVDCDPRNVLCRAATPECPSMQVPSVEGTCYGPCVDVESCACSSAEACPLPDQYTCWSKTHCGPYVN